MDMIEPIEVEVGLCKTCKHYSEIWDDPGARDCSLAPAQMLVEVRCDIEEELPDDCEHLGQDMNNQCPKWELTESIYFCSKHSQWVWGECSICAEELSRY